VNKTIEVSVNDIARFGAATAVVHAFLAETSCRFEDGLVPTGCATSELATGFGIYGKVLDMAFRKLETAQYIVISDDGQSIGVVVGVD
jgi:hypothetical protein